MSPVGVDERLTDRYAGEPTLASTWEAIVGGRMTDELLEWPPDAFALTNVVLDRSAAFRFALSPVGAWPRLASLIGPAQSRRRAANGLPGSRVGGRQFPSC
jgi:hypothetical protein